MRTVLYIYIIYIYIPKATSAPPRAGTTGIYYIFHILLFKVYYIYHNILCLINIFYILYIFDILYILFIYCIYIYMYIIMEGGLEVKLPTVWTDEKQRWAEAERREEQKREDQRRERVRSKKIQVREKVRKSRNIVFFR